MTAPKGPLRICASLRLERSRLSPLRVLEILDALLSRSSTERLHLSIYGAPSEALAKYASSNGFDIQRLARAKLLGKLGRADLAQQLRGCDVCMDLMAWQTFARSGLESMACGCVPMLPNYAGAREYAADGVNALLVNATDIQQAIARAEKLMDGEYDLAAMRDAALEAAARFAMHRTRASSAETFKAFQIRWLQSERGYQLIGHSQSMSALRGR